MSTSYKLEGLIGPPQSNGEDSHQEIQYSTLAGAHQAAGPAPIIPPVLLMPSTPQPHSIPSLNHGPWVSKLTSNSNLGGLMDMQGLSVVQVSSQSTAFVKRKFPAEMYSEVKKHVVSYLLHLMIGFFDACLLTCLVE
jgi:hypothetical protein